jgi:transposase
MTLLAAMSLEGMGAAMVLEGATDTAAFEVYVEQVLVPTLRKGQVVLDNLNVHKGARVRELIEGAECEVWYLPSYSPDLSPIEEGFSKLKTWLRRAKARTQDALLDALAAGLDEITTSDARGYFMHCGYHIPQDEDH